MLLLVLALRDAPCAEGSMYANGHGLLFDAPVRMPHLLVQGPLLLDGFASDVASALTWLVGRVDSLSTQVAQLQSAADSNATLVLQLQQQLISDAAAYNHSLMLLTEQVIQLQQGVEDEAAASEQSVTEVALAMQQLQSSVQANATVQAKETASALLQLQAQVSNDVTALNSTLRPLVGGVRQLQRRVQALEGNATAAAAAASCFPLTLVHGDGGVVSAPMPSSNTSCAANSFAAGAALTLNAVPASADYVFGGWSGAVISSNASLSFTMPTAPATLTAVFVRCYTLTLNSTGASTSSGVTVQPASSAWCPTGSFVVGAAVTLVAMPSNGQTCVGWSNSGGGINDAMSLTLTMPAANTRVTSIFADCITLSIVYVGAASGSMVRMQPSASGTCAAGSFVSGAVVTLTSMPADGQTLRSWSINGTIARVPTISIAMPEHSTVVTATFADCLALSVAASIGGSVGVTPSSSVGCPAGSFVNGTTVLVSALASSKYVFMGWSGASSLVRVTPLSVVIPAAGTLLAQYRVASAALLSLNATQVWGQGNFTTRTQWNGDTQYPVVPTYGGLNGPFDARVDPATGELYVPDCNNARVLVFANVSTSALSRVLGQSSFTDVTSGTANNRLNIPVRTAVDSRGGVYVADWANNRVLYFPAGSSNATRVYGQSDFSHQSGSSGVRGLSSPAGVALDADDNLYVADRSNHRVLFFAKDNTTAARVYGQSNNFAGSSPGCSSTAFNSPNAVAVDPLDGGLYAADAANNRVLYYAAGSTSVARVYGQNGYMACNQNGGNTNAPTADTLAYPRGLALDAAGGLVVADANNNRVVYYPRGSTTATRVWGQQGSFTSMDTNKGGISAASLNGPTGVGFDSLGYLLIADQANNRVLHFTL